MQNAPSLNQQLNMIALQQPTQTLQNSEMQRSGTNQSNYKEGKPERIFDPKPPNVLAAISQHSSSGNALLNHQQVIMGNDDPSMLAMKSGSNSNVRLEALEMGGP